MTTENMDIRMTARMGAIPLWKLAKKLHISEPTLYRKLREPLDETERLKFYEALNQLMMEHSRR